VYVVAAQRTRRPRGSLTPEIILDAAEAVAEQGFDALSMRAVAARLEAVPMALYNHFATKEQLVAALLDRVLGRFEPPPESQDWLEDLRRFARAHRRLLSSHAWAVAPIFSNPSPGLSSVRPRPSGAPTAATRTTSSCSAGSSKGWPHRITGRPTSP
jgi:AcrR family transcriptional regulator